MSIVLMQIIHSEMTYKMTYNRTLRMA